MSQQRGVHASNSPPRTPPSQTAKYRPKRGYPTRPSIRDAFPDAAADNAPRASESGDERDPHDLSLSPKHAARTSIVDNMLLSLDQFDGPGSSVLDDYRLFNSAFETDFQGRYRGHTFSSSMSSEADFGYDDGSGSRYATITANGRRSNSSSNHQTAPRRMSSARGRDALGSRGGTLPRANDVRKGSKGSSSNADYSYTMSRGRADSDGRDRRSESFDCGPKKAFIPYADHGLGQDSLLYDDDAAPTPSIPAGPRKLYDYRTPNAAVSRTPGASRRNSVKSSNAPQVRKNRPENIGTGALKVRDKDFLGDTDLDLPPTIPASLDPPAPSPTISYNKPAFPQPDPAATITTTAITANPTISANTTNTNKERPGFFRRVFGGSSKASSPAESPSSNMNDISYFQENETKDSTTAASNLKGREQQQVQQPQQQQPPKSAVAATPTPAVRKGPPQLVKQKSSFFRRRKKSVAEHVPPPIKLPQDLAPHNLDTIKPEPSPVSSLRQIMNPYLDEPGAPANTDRKENRREESRPIESASLQAQRPRESISAPSGVSKSKQNLQTTSRGQDSRLPLAEIRGTSDHAQKASDVESISSAESPLQERNSNVNPSTSLSPVAEDFSRTIRVSTKMAPPTDSSRDSLTAASMLTLPSDSNAPESPAASEASQYLTASNTPVIESEEPKAVSDKDDEENPANGPGDAVEDGPTASDREQAQNLFDSQNQVVGNVPAAAWLGEPDRAMVREAYMRLFNWSNMNILAALRSLCQRLVLKGETQQVDRVLDAFSCRWCDCNPSHGFKATGKCQSSVTNWYKLIPL